MTNKRQERMLGILLSRAGWVTAADLANRLGVTARSVRSYVTAVNALSDDGEAIEPGPRGYRATPAAARVRDELRGTGHGAPRQRIRTLIRMLMDTDAGFDVFDAAQRLHVSEATVESDLRRVRAMLPDGGPRLEREDGMVRLNGTERSRRRFLVRAVLDDLDGRVFDTEALSRAAAEMGISVPAPGEFSAELVERLAERGYVVNELSLAEVVLRVAIAVERAGRGYRLPESGGDGDPEREAVGGIIDELAMRYLGEGLGRAELAHLAGVVLVSLVEAGAAHDVDPRVTEAVRASLAHAAAAYGLDLSDEEFIRGFAGHVHNMVQRSMERVGARNPMARSVKLASPLVFEVAVSVASELGDRLEVSIPDDEIADMAMRIGSLAGAAVEEPPLRAVLVCPGYEGMRRQLRAHLERAFGHELTISRVETGYAPDEEGADADLVLTTVDAPAGGDRIVRIQPFLTSRDIAKVADAVQRVRRQRRLSGLRAEMRRWFVPSAFIRNAAASGPEEMIRMLGEALVREGVIGEEYVESAIEREGRSSTAFTESLAVPHAMTMSASRTAIAVAVNENAVEWSGERVHVVALVAFSEADRAAFQTVFEQFVDVFADPENVGRIVRRGDTLASFLDEIAALIDAPG